MKYEIQDKIPPKFFGKQFSKAFDKWKQEGEGRTQESFGRNEFTDIVSRQTVNSWYKGRSVPDDDHMKQLIRIFGVPEDYFTIKDDSDAYQGSSEFMTRVGEDVLFPYCEEIGLDLDFLRLLKDHMNFEEDFPLWRPIHTVFPNKLMDVDFGLEPERALPESAPMEDPVLQIERKVEMEDGTMCDRLITMNRADLLFLRDVQQDVIEYVEFLFMKRARQMEEEPKELERRVRIKYPDGRTVFKKVTWDLIKEVAPYFKAFKDPEK